MAVGICLLSASSLKAQNANSDFRWPQGRRVAVSFSFDDARLSQIDVGTPLLDKYGVKATFYVSPRSVEKRLDGWKKAVASGHEIGNHSLTHPCTVNFGFSQQNALENYTIPMMEKQLDDANTEIQRLLGVKPVTFAYPCGQKFIGRGAGVQSYVPLVAKRFLAGRGFRDEMSNVPAACDLAQVLGTDSDGLTFEQMRDLVVTASQQGRWIAFAGHEIGKPGRQVTLAAALEQFIQYAKDPANGVWLDTVQAVAKHIQAQRGAR